MRCLTSRRSTGNTVPWSCRRCRSLLRDEEKACDAMQETFVRLLRRKRPSRPRRPRASCTASRPTCASTSSAPRRRRPEAPGRRAPGRSIAGSDDVEASGQARAPHRGHLRPGGGVDADHGRPALRGRPHPGGDGGPSRALGVGPAQAAPEPARAIEDIRWRRANESRRGASCPTSARAIRVRRISLPRRPSVEAALAADPASRSRLDEARGLERGDTRRSPPAEIAASIRRRMLSLAMPGGRRVAALARSAKRRFGRLPDGPSAPSPSPAAAAVLVLAGAVMARGLLFRPVDELRGPRAAARASSYIRRPPPVPSSSPTAPPPPPATSCRSSTPRARPASARYSR